MKMCFDQATPDSQEPSTSSPSNFKCARRCFEEREKMLEFSYGSKKYQLLKKTPPEIQQLFWQPRVARKALIQCIFSSPLRGCETVAVRRSPYQEQVEAFSST